jgi:hypothetical protein
MQDLRELLQSIKSGTRNFTPDGNTETAIGEFQATVKALVHADEQGFLDGFQCKKESSTGNRRYIHAHVSNGLTYTGEKYLEEASKVISRDGSASPRRAAISIPDLLQVLDLAARNELPETIDRTSNVSLQAAWELFEAGHISGTPAQSVNGPCLFAPAITLSGRLFLEERKKPQTRTHHSNTPLSITLDTNCIINLFDRQSLTATSVSEINTLIRYGLSGKLTIAVTTRVEVDMLQDGVDERRNQMLRTLEAFPVVGSIGLQDASSWNGNGDPASDRITRLRSEIRGIVFPGLQPDGNRYHNKMNDVEHLLGHILNERGIFVTNDGAILRSSENLKSTLGIFALSPAQCVSHIDAIAARSIPTTASSASPNPAYHSPGLRGVVKFDYSNNNHRYAIGHGHFLFETQWSKASDTSIYALDNPESIRCIAVAKGASEIRQIADATGYDFSSHHRNPRLGEIVIWINKHALYAATKIVSIKDDGRGSEHDELEFEYVILTDGTSDFSRGP